MMGAAMDPALSSRARPAALTAAGVLLFLFIPVVLFLYVRHPPPVGLSLAAGAVLMVGHRWLARPYMRRALPWKCIWCNRVLPPEAGAETASLELRAGAETLSARCCPAHRDPAARFFTFVQGWRWPLRLGIFLPLLALLAALAAAAAGRAVRLDAATALFQLAVGITVNVAALGTLFVRPQAPGAPVAVPFPVHNFFLLGVRLLLWIFRLVGIWWIWKGIAFFVRA
jgi:hypothetical protein